VQEMQEVQSTVAVQAVVQQEVHPNQQALAELVELVQAAGTNQRERQEQREHRTSEQQARSRLAR
jgi:hypothetical protein